jgi:hypothetical protein
MFNIKPNLTIRTGLFLTALAWFTFTFYEFTNGLLHNIHPDAENPVWNYLVLQETGGCVGLGLRTAGGLVAVIASMFYLVKRDLSEPEALMALRLVVIFEASYWLSFLFSIIPSEFTRLTVMTIENNIPVTVQSIVLPIVLVMLFLNLSPKKAATGGIKWGLISGTVYILVIWLNNACNWIVEVVPLPGAEFMMVKGIDYITLYPANLFSFVLTVVGLLLLTLYTAYFSKKSIGKHDFTKINLRTVGVIITALGLYFDIIYVMYLFLGPVGGWNIWYAWFTGHNLDLWLMALPFAGLPLLFQKRGQP